VTADEAGARCDVAIARLSGASRAQVASAIRAGGVRLNGSLPKQATPVADGDLLEFAIAEPVALDAQPEEIELDIVFEDEALLVVDKPAAIRCGRGSSIDSIATRRACSSSRKPRPRCARSARR